MLKERFQELLISIRDSLTVLGFERRGSTFYTQAEGNWGLIGIQKSLKSAPTEILFTVNLGVCSTELQRFEGKKDDKRPVADDCQWRCRLGFLLPENEDVWWRIGSNTSISHLSAEIIGKLVGVAVPAILGHISDEALITEWLAGRSDGLTEFQRYIFLTALLKIRNDSRLPAILRDFREYSAVRSLEWQFDSHVTRLESYG